MKFIPDSVTRSLGRAILHSQKNSPQILFVAGIAGVVGGTVLACRATLKVEPVIDEMKHDLDAVKFKRENPKKHNHPYSDNEYHKELGYVTGKGITKLVKLYGPSVIIGGLGIAALTGSHIILKNRNSALTTTLAAVAAAHEEYRARVKEAIGEDRERDIYLNAKDEISAEENGKAKLVKVANPKGWSPYARAFDEGAREYRKNAELNRMFIQCQQKHANDLLNVRGHFLLNDAYDSLGFDRTPEGSIMGWIKESGTYIDFGIYDEYNLPFMLGYERSIILDFNIDGVVYDKI